MIAFLKLALVALAISFIVGAVRSVLAGRFGQRKIRGRKNNDTDFISEELYKLHELKNRGILTDEEYLKQKNKLLNK